MKQGTSIGSSSPGSPTLTTQFIRSALSLPSKSETVNHFSLITTDSRKIQRGCLFVALKGDKFDGHDFVMTAIQKGAAGVLVKKGTTIGHSSVPIEVFEVQDTLEAYRTLAGAWRKEFDIPVTVVAGSVGKTTTKELLSAMLRGKWPRLLKTEASLNGFIGVAMTLLELNLEHQAAVIEVGIDEPGAMEKHIPLIGAKAVVLTAIGPEHLEKLIDIPTVAKEECKAFELIAQSGGTVIVNLDDPWIVKGANSLPEKTNRFEFTIGSGAPSPQKLVAKWNPEPSELIVSGAGLESARFQIPIPGEHNSRNALAAIAVAVSWGLTEEEIRRGLATFKSAEGRSQVRESKDGIRFLCDFYNANPTSTEAGIKVLQTLPKSGGKTWACLGDMLELGKDEEAFHRQLANPLTALKINGVLLYGPRMKALEDELTRKNFPGFVRHFDSHASMVAEILKKASPGDAVLIKGSRGMKMEEVYKPIIEKKGTLA